MFHITNFCGMGRSGLENCSSSKLKTYAANSLAHHSCGGKLIETSPDNVYLILLSFDQLRIRINSAFRLSIYYYIRHFLDKTSKLNMSEINIDLLKKYLN